MMKIILQQESSSRSSEIVCKWNGKQVDDKSIKIKEVDENDYCTIIVPGNLSITDFCFQVGDEIIETDTCGKETELTTIRPPFDGATGYTEVILTGKCAGNDFKIKWVVYVKLSKVSIEQYESMFSFLNQVSPSLLYDIIGKSKKEPWITERNDRQLANNEKFNSIVRYWPRILCDITNIMDSPFEQTIRSKTLANPYGKVASNPHNSKALMQLKSSQTSGTLSSKIYLYKTNYSFDVPEHRFIKSSLLKLKRYIQEINQIIQNDIDEKNDDFSEENSQKNELNKRKSQSTILLKVLNNILSTPFWSDIHEMQESAFFIPRHINDYYSDIFYIFNYALKMGYEWENDDEMNMHNIHSFMTKKTEKIYEQWVLINLIYAFQKQGYFGQGIDSHVENTISKNFFFNLSKIPDFISDFPSGKNRGYRLRFRYEPKLPIKSSEKDLEAKESLYTPAEAKHEWCPDFLLELQKSNNNNHKYQTIYAIVIDAKYSNYLKTQWQKVEKYFKIETAENKCVVKQIWLCYPGNRNDKDSNGEMEVKISGNPLKTENSQRNGEFIIRPTANVEEKDIATISFDFVRKMLGFLEEYIKWYEQSK